MKILITGANGFIGKNLVWRLENIKNNDNDDIGIEEIYKYDRHCNLADLEKYIKDADFIFHLAGVNRSEDAKTFVSGNVDLTKKILNLLTENNKKTPIMFSSSIQATLKGRYNGTPYAVSKSQAERELFAFADENNSKVIVYRFPNVFGKWCKPNYNSVVATFCYNMARDLPITINDKNTELDLVYIDDLVEELILCLKGREHYQEGFGIVPEVYHVTLNDIVRQINEFKKYEKTYYLPKMVENSFAKKLCSTYLNYLPKEKTTVDLKMNVDGRGSFTELFKTVNFGQFSVNVSKPGITKGNHYHNSKWEFFIVVSGKALIRQRNIVSGEVYEVEVSDKKMQAVYMLPGYTHSIYNLSDTDSLVTLMWANEVFDRNRTDTYYEMV